MGAPGHRRYTVLIVDDNQDLLDLVAESLMLLGNYAILTALTGAAGLERAAAEPPDCMVIDVKMPGLDGYQLVRALRGDPATAEIPLVILTALTQDQHRFGAFLAGADRYLMKPIKPSDLVAAIEEAIRVSEAERARRLQSLAEGMSPEDL
jgi:CheY-like chemotaxis protein